MTKENTQVARTAKSKESSCMWNVLKENIGTSFKHMSSICSTEYESFSIFFFFFCIISCFVLKRFYIGQFLKLISPHPELFSNKITLTSLFAKIYPLHHKKKEKLFLLLYFWWMNKKKKKISIPIKYPRNERARSQNEEWFSVNWIGFPAKVKNEISVCGLRLKAHLRRFRWRWRLLRQ